MESWLQRQPQRRTAGEGATALVGKSQHCYPARARHPLQKAPTIIGRAAETEAQRTLRLFGTLQDFGEHDLVLRWGHEGQPGVGAACLSSGAAW